MLDAAPLLGRAGQFALLGSGDAALEAAFRDAAADAGAVAVRIGRAKTSPKRLIADRGVLADPTALLCAVVSRPDRPATCTCCPRWWTSWWQRGGQLAVLGEGD